MYWECAHFFLFFHQAHLVRLCNAGAIIQNVLNSEFHCDSRPRIAASYQTLEVLVLAYKFVLHGVPHHLLQKRKWKPKNCEGKWLHYHTWRTDCKRESRIWYSMVVKKMHSEASILSPSTFKTCDLKFLSVNKAWLTTLLPPSWNGNKAEFLGQLWHMQAPGML